MAGLNLNIDATQIDAATKKAKAGLDGVAASARTTEAALKKAGGGGDELKRKFDPAYSAALKLGNELDDLDRALKVGAIDAKVYAAEIGRMGGATNTAGGFMGRFGNRIQQTGYQVGDFAVQVGAGTSAAQALGQQLPQLLGAFGPLGAVLGVVAAIGVPLGAAFWNMGEKAVDAAKAIDDLTASTEAMQSITNVAIEDQYAKYGRLTESIKGALVAQQQLALSAAQSAAGTAVASLGEGYADQAVRVRELATELKALPAFDKTSMTRELYDLNTSMIKNEIAAIGDEIGLTSLQMVDLSFAYEQFANADGARQQADAISEIRDAMAGTALETSEYSGQLTTAQLELYASAKASDDLSASMGTSAATTVNLAAEASNAFGNVMMIADAATSVDEFLGYALDTSTDLANSAPGGGWMNDAIASVSGLIGSLSTALGLKNALGGAQAGGSDASRNSRDDGGFSDAVGLRTSVKPKRAPNGLAGVDWGSPVSTSGSGGGKRGGAGGGGISAAEKASNAYDSLIASLDPAERSTQALAKAQETVNAALKVGAISAAEAANAMKLAGEKYTEASGSAKYWADINKDLKSSFLDMAIDGVNSFDDIAKSIKRAALEALLFKSGPLAGMFGGSTGGGSGFGSLISGIFGGGGGFAGLFDSGGTIGMGKTGIVGENGPEAVTSKPNGALVTSRVNTARQMQGGGGGAMQVHVTTSVDNEGGIKNFVRTSVAQGMNAAVDTARKSMPGWSKSYQTYGA